MPRSVGVARAVPSRFAECGNTEPLLAQRDGFLSHHGSLFNLKFWGDYSCYMF